ncbi:T-cell surface glycoprotein CD3 gamma chain [Tachyglossus aculeatus]|uniref:T-cell surface glycoprotein CD3 gamma chain n=1 Tax=Tachyglossus aculeatus TaxID=9261 RepID=UPI0018F64F85|nr:T-cell surface glycoprotein CD3 gamma chain [Tachyglossus aculeatus]
MAWSGHLASLVVVGVLLRGADSANSSGIASISVEDDRSDGTVMLTCSVNNEKVEWNKDGHFLGNSNATLNVGRMVKDPRGVYRCSNTNNQPLHLYYRMCQNCIELNPGTLSGLVLADILAIFFLAVGIYCVAGQDEGRASRASDKQTLLPNDQLYQPLRDRDDGQYSHIGGGGRPRKK